MLEVWTVVSCDNKNFDLFYLISKIRNIFVLQSTISVKICSDKCFQFTY